MENCQPRPQPSSRRHVSELVEVVRSMAQAKFAVVATSAVTFFISICVMLASVSSALAENTRDPYEHKSYLALPNQKCKIPPPSKWTKPEKWVWKEICEGKVADFDFRPDARPFDPRKQKDSENWSDRTLRSSFLETILLHEPFRSAIPRQGVHIIGACFPEPIDLSDASIDRPLKLSLSLFRSEVDMRRLRTSSFISLEGSKFNGELDMDSVTVEGSLFMGDKAEFQEVYLINAKIGTSIYIDSSKFNGRLDMDSVTVEGSLFMWNEAEFQDVYLIDAKIGTSIDMGSSKFNGELDMDSVTVEGSLFMWDEAEFQEVHLIDAKIGTSIYMDNSKFNGDLNMDSVTVNGSLMMQKASFKNSARLLLRHSNVGTLTLQDNKEVWPKILRLEGFTYQGLGGMDEINHVDPLKEWLKKHKPYSPHLGGFTYQGLSLVTEGDQEGPSKHESGWFEEWLKKHKPYSPQPYRQLASVLRTSGQGGTANDILFASRNRELEESNMLEGKWWSLFLLKIFIGYGYGKGQLLALGWAGALLLIGFSVLHLTKERNRHEEIHKSWDTLFYSLDMLLPIIRLRELHYKNVDLKTGARYYFYFHKIMGYVLTFFLIAALSGLAS